MLRSLLSKVEIVEDGDKKLLFKSSIYRGINNMIRILGNEYLTFLRENGLLNQILKYAKEHAMKGTKDLNSLELLEQLADILREKVMIDDKGKNLIMRSYGE